MPASLDRLATLACPKSFCQKAAPQTPTCLAIQDGWLLRCLKERGAPRSRTCTHLGSYCGSFLPYAIPGPTRPSPATTAWPVSSNESAEYSLNHHQASLHLDQSQGTASAQANWCWKEHTCSPPNECKYVPARKGDEDWSCLSRHASLML